MNSEGLQAITGGTKDLIFFIQECVSIKFSC